MIRTCMQKKKTLADFNSAVGRHIAKQERPGDEAKPKNKNTNLLFL